MLLSLIFYFSWILNSSLESWTPLSLSLSIYQWLRAILRPHFLFLGPTAHRFRYSLLQVPFLFFILLHVTKLSLQHNVDPIVLKAIQQSKIRVLHKKDITVPLIKTIQSELVSMYTDINPAYIENQSHKIFVDIIP